MIKITLETIYNHHPCHEGWRRVLEANGKGQFPVSSILDSNSFIDTVWTLRCLHDYDELWRKFACWCVLDSIELIGNVVNGIYMGNNYEAVLDYLNDPEEYKRRHVLYILRSLEYPVNNGDPYNTAVLLALDILKRVTCCTADTSAFRVVVVVGSDSYTTRKRQINKLRQILDAGEWVD